MPVPSTSPIHLTTPQPFQGIVNAANTARDGTGTLVTLLTALAAASGGQGGAVLGLRLTHGGAITVASTPLVARLWHVRSGTARLIRELALAAATPSASVIGTSVALAAADLPELAAGDSLAISASVAEPVHAYGTYREY